MFLSYDHDDIGLARPLAAALEKAGHIVWYDRHIQGGAQYSRKIEQALDEADAVIVLWSAHSLDSPWVRDEAAEGRDRGKLIPLTVAGVTPPMGFRQFQTIDLGGWSGRGKVPKLTQLIEAVEGQAPDGPEDAEAAPRTRRRVVAEDDAGASSRWMKLAAIAALLLAIGAAVWWWIGRSAMPVVAVAAADPSPRSQAAAGDLYVKLGSLAQIGDGKWQLVDGQAGKRADLEFRTSDSGAGGEPRANLVLLDGKRDVLLWSREFAVPGGALADLRQQLSLTAGRVLGCALEARDSGGLKTDLLKRFLDACAIAAEASVDDPSRLIAILRSIVTAELDFTPAWSLLLQADAIAYDLGDLGVGDRGALERALKADIAAAKKIDPDMPAVTLAEVTLAPRTDYGGALDRLSRAATNAPNDARVQAALSGALLQVGRMEDALRAAELAAKLDPLSPTHETSLILAMAYAGRVDDARRELDRFARQWAGTGALRDAMWAFHLRFGDPDVAQRFAPHEAGEGLRIYLQARRTRSAQDVGRVIEVIERERAPADRHRAYGWAVYALGEFGRVDEALAWIAEMPTEKVAKDAYLLFRAPMAPLRADPRFMAVAKRIGLLGYWQKSGEWPDFCTDPKLPYDCRTEGQKLG
ncbi:TIR domain-containing protein [Sphingomonas mesophila]|uniref:TIR domain-containing protein n=1 Tax=Sphingomonas mesophila TaxID=2303576 RepID=UPI001F07EA2B|nr:TIR domain-containing protein [Sphingomonas mesophila]